jgi:pilus assembly protein CpaC
MRTLETLRRALFILVIALLGEATLWAQGPALPMASVTAASAAEPETNSVRLLVGRSTVVDVGSAILRVSLTSPDVADALVTSPSQLLINGKMPGTISMFVWERSGNIRRYELIVQRDLSRLNEQLHQLFPGESIAVQSNGKDVVLSGLVSSKEIVDKAVNLAAGYVDKKEEVVSLLRLQELGASNQVLLRVRFAEVSRNAMTELGASLFTSPTGVQNTIGRVTTQQFAAPGFDELQSSKAGSTSAFGQPVTSASGKFTFSDFLNLFLFSEKYDLGLMVRALQTRGMFQSLAEPNLVAESGKEASFLAGGEFPIPIAQGSGANMAITVQFKEFGVRLNFTPTVEGDRIHLKVRPEVSTLDFSNGVVLNGFRIPALSTRRAETELELRDGQTFAIAGLMNNTVTNTLSKVPGIGDIPILGQLFKSKAAQKNQTELVVLITPQILPKGSHGVTAELPRLPEPFLPPLPQKKSFDPPPAPFRPGRTEASAPAPVPTVPPASAQPSAADAARVVSALTPAGPKPLEPAPAATVPSTPPAMPAMTRPLTPAEQKILDRARRQEREQAQAGARTQAEEARRAVKQADADRTKAALDHARQEKLAKEQAKRDAEAAKAAEETAKKQGEIDRRHQKALEEAQAKLKAAEAAYQAELAKKNKS